MGCFGCLGVLECLGFRGVLGFWGVWSFGVFGGFGCLEVLGCLGVTVKGLGVKVKGPTAKGLNDWRIALYRQLPYRTVFGRGRAGI